MIDVGQTVGNYNITATLGAGGMGTVFLAEHPIIGSKVAVKAIHPQFARSLEVFSRFVNEAKAVNQIGHDHIIDITDFGTAPTGDCYFMMEYLEGVTLATAIKLLGRLPPARALNIAAQIADALGAAHDHGIIHRDLKPENIFLIVRDGVQDFVKVLDFGLAKLTNPNEIATYESRVGSVMGTPFYMSPEQCEGRAEIDHRGDIYALGVMLFEMLTGMIPFGGDGYGEILVKHVTVPPPAARSIVPDLPEALDSILLRSLAKEPAQRFQTMAEMREALLAPDRYASIDPLPAGLPEELAGRVRAAHPMARAGLSAPPPLAAGPGTVHGMHPGNSMFTDSIGEIWVREKSRRVKPQTHRLRGVLILGAFAGALVAGVKYRHQTTRFLDRGVAAMSAASQLPVRVRVKVDSQPEGATVERLDGAPLGLTPLSMDVPYDEAELQYLIRKDGYELKTVAVVPNRPSAIVAVLQRAQTASAPVPIVPVVAATPVEAPSVPPLPLKKATPKRSGHAPAKTPPVARAVPTIDDAMDPTAPTDQP